MGLPTPMKVISRMKKLQKSGSTGILLALGGDNWSLDYGTLALHLFTSPFHVAAKVGFLTCVWGGSISQFSKSPVREPRILPDEIRKMLDSSAVGINFARFSRRVCPFSKCFFVSKSLVPTIFTFGECTGKSFVP